ncbi:S8 family serine peptidase [Streptomyces sp. NPDC050738]|uniref:S8 family peptidase n=1 Tax=Streptomyces sp. NPDC050738 TaxID=3154744 RepID=UPI00341DCC93
MSDRQTHATSPLLRRSRIALVGTALGAVLCSTATTPAVAAPLPTSGWESAALGLPAAQRVSQGEGVTVAVLDTGVMVNHPALKGKVTTGPDLAEDGIKSSSPKWGVHGTAMASDVLKVAPRARILSVRVIDENQGGSWDATTGPTKLSKAIDYAVAHNADVITMSLGSEARFGGYNDAEANAIGNAISHGVPVLASAGNDGGQGKENRPSYPAGYASVIAVAATMENGIRAPFSTVRTYNSVAAPGVQINSASRSGGTKLVAGTSPACALAAGVVALMLSKNDKLTVAQTRTILTTTAHHPTSGHNALVGYGTINAAAAVRAAASPPVDTAATTELKGQEHLATPDGTQKMQHLPLDPIYWWGGLGTAAVGLLMVIGCVLLLRKGRRTVGS